MGGESSSALKVEDFVDLFRPAWKAKFEEDAYAFDRWLMEMYTKGDQAMGGDVTYDDFRRVIKMPPPSSEDLRKAYDNLVSIIQREHPVDDSEPEFHPFAKIARLRRDCVVTEKIDGTNAQIWISDDGSRIMAGCRTRWVTPGKQTDNYGFAAWVEANKDELLKLGPGRHFGEWWGAGVQRTYGLKEKRFSLFNVGRWMERASLEGCWKSVVPTPLVRLVPVLYRGAFDIQTIDNCVEHLRERGSVAAPGFMKPEGIVVWHAASGTLFKQTLEKDEKPKGSTE